MSASPSQLRVPLRDWRTFQKEFSQFRFDAVLSRAALGLPRWFIRASRGGVLPSCHVLRRIGYDPNSPRRVGWIEWPSRFVRTIDRFGCSRWFDITIFG